MGDENVACYKIPSLIRTAKGNLLAFVEARHVQCGDGGNIDLRMRRSSDNGLSWSHAITVYSEAQSGQNTTIGDACPVQDRRTGIVHLIFTRNNRDVYQTQSADEGVTWAPPVNISGSVDGHREPPGFIGTGHAGGVQLSRTGRLLVPMHGPCHAIYSDNGGQTWAKARGAMSNGGECQMVEIRDGLLVVTGRNSKKIGYQQIAFSTDDGMTWSESEPNHDLPSPIDGVESSILVHPNGKLYHSGPNSFLLRTDMVLKVSHDDGKSWQPFREVWKNAAGYSALTLLGQPGDTNAGIGILFDRNNKTMIVFEARGITFASIDVV
jgi:sialidase-1